MSTIEELSEATLEPGFISLMHVSPKKTEITEDNSRPLLPAVSSSLSVRNFPPILQVQSRFSSLWFEEGLALIFVFKNWFHLQESINRLRLVGSDGHLDLAALSRELQKIDIAGNVPNQSGENSQEISVYNEKRRQGSASLAPNFSQNRKSHADTIPISNFPEAIQQKLRDLDQDFDGHIDANEVLNGIEALAREKRTAKLQC